MKEENSISDMILAISNGAAERDNVKTDRLRTNLRGIGQVKSTRSLLDDTKNVALALRRADWSGCYGSSGLAVFRTTCRYRTREQRLLAFDVVCVCCGSVPHCPATSLSAFPISSYASNGSETRRAMSAAAIEHGIAVVTRV